MSNRYADTHKREEKNKASQMRGTSTQSDPPPKRHPHIKLETVISARLKSPDQVMGRRSEEALLVTAYVFTPGGVRADGRTPPWRD